MLKGIKVTHLATKHDPLSGKHILEIEWIIRVSRIEGIVPLLTGMVSVLVCGLVACFFTSPEGA